MGASRTGAIIGPDAQSRWRLSDINLKRNITPIDNALNRLTNMSFDNDRKDNEYKWK